jgi:hypothetical protein
VIRTRLLRLVIAVAVLALTAFGTASAVASTSAPSLPSSTGLPTSKFLLLGDVARPPDLGRGRAAIFASKER